LAAVVLDPVADELFSATRHGPALCNGQPLTPTLCETLARALVGTGFAYDAELRVAQAQVAQRVIPAARDIRRAGAAALDLCACAAGRLDAYWERDVNHWDIAAGSLICERAGLSVRTLEPAGGLPAGVIVAAPALIDELSALVS
jgi:myo-inositol-1(or 4)-monophosphatase